MSNKYWRLQEEAFRIQIIIIDRINNIWLLIFYVLIVRMLLHINAYLATQAAGCWQQQQPTCWHHWWWHTMCCHPRGLWCHLSPTFSSRAHQSGDCQGQTQCPQPVSHRVAVTLAPVTPVLITHQAKKICKKIGIWHCFRHSQPPGLCSLTSFPFQKSSECWAYL